MSEAWNKNHLKNHDEIIYFHSNDYYQEMFYFRISPPKENSTCGILESKDFLMSFITSWKPQEKLSIV